MGLPWCSVPLLFRTWHCYWWFTRSVLCCTDQFCVQVLPQSPNWCRSSHEAGISCTIDYFRRSLVSIYFHRCQIFPDTQSQSQNHSYWKVDVLATIATRNIPVTTSHFLHAIYPDAHATFHLPLAFHRPLAPCVRTTRTSRTLQHRYGRRYRDSSHYLIIFVMLLWWCVKVVWWCV